MTYATQAVFRQTTRTRDGRPATERIEQLEAEVEALRAEIVRLREEKGEGK